MFLKQVREFSPNEHGLTINATPDTIAIHPSSDYLAFVTRGEQLVMSNRKTGRTSVIYRSKHVITFVMFTDIYLIAIDKNYSEILVFAIKAEKLKKKITGHRSRVLKMAYSAQRGIFCSISHDLCIIWKQATLNIEKKIKCSTSQYVDCLISPNGECLFTSFSDGNIFRWDLDSFTNTQAALKIQPHLLSCTYSQFIVAYFRENLMVADFSAKGLVFEQIQSFWEGNIQKIAFSSNNILIKTKFGLYIGEISLDHRIQVKFLKQLIDPVHTFIIGGYGEQVIIINKELTNIKTMKLYSEPSSQKIPLTNTLINPGSQCAGGFSNQLGCTVEQNSLKIYQYNNQQYKVEELNNGLYLWNNSLQNEKLKVFIKKNFYFPDKYRPIAYKSLLSLPINKNMYRQLEKLGRHESVKMLESKYPLENRNLSEAFKDIMSVLANYSPIFAESQDAPSIVFPFICLLGNDKFQCFEILYRLFNNWLSFLFTDFPLANSDLLQNIHQILQIENPKILNHLKDKEVSFTKLVWHFFSTLFSSNVKREVFLTIIDNLFSHPSEPQLVVFMVIGYICYNESRILSIRSQEDMTTYLDSQHTVNTSFFMKKVYFLKEKYSKHLRYQFQSFNPQFKRYIPFNDYPQHALKMYEGKRRLQQQQYDKVMDNNRYHEQMTKQMDKMVIKAKRQAQIAQIQGQSVALQKEKQCKNKLNIPKINQSLRKQKLEKLVVRIKELIEQSQQKKVAIKQFAPLINQVYEEENDEQLSLLQEKLMNLLTKFELNRFHRPLNSIPIPLGKTKTQDYKKMKAAKNSQIARIIWENDQIQHKVQQNNWERDCMKQVR